MLTSEHIKEIRKKMGLSTTDFGSRVGVSAFTVGRWEIGDRHPRYKAMEKLNELAKEYGVDLSESVSA